MWVIKCGECGKKRSMDLWTKTVMNPNLPLGHFQCPECKIAVRRTIYKYKWVKINGNRIFIPERIILERTPSYL